jgi:hypothetical protein
MVKRPQGRHNGALCGLKKVVTMLRNEDLRTDKTPFGIIDAQSVQNAGSAGAKGYDAGKKVSAIKRHIIVDTRGLSHAVIVTTANVPDRQRAIEMIGSHRENWLLVRTYLVDGDYSGEQFPNAVKEVCGAEVEVVKGNELNTFEVLPSVTSLYK